jgi:hypothetical protein
MSEADRDLEGTDKPRKSVVKRLLLGSAVVVALLGGLAYLQSSWQGKKVRRSLEETLAWLDETDPGWRLEDIEKARPAPPEERDSAVLLKAARRLVPAGAPNEKELERLAPPPPPPELLDPERAALLEKELLAVEAALAEARKVADMPAGRHAIVHASNPIATLLPQVQEMREVARLLQLDALRWGQRGDGERAMRSAAACFNTGRSFGDEPFLISQLVRNACIQVAAGAIERALAVSEPPEKTLADVQALVELEEAHPTLLVGLRGERAIQHELMASLTDGSVPRKSLFADFPSELRPDKLMERWQGAAPMRREHPLLLRVMSRAIDVARLPAHEQAAGEEALREEIDRLPRQSSVLTRAMLPATEKVGVACRRKLALVRCLKAALALERRRRESGAWVGKLEELVPKVLRSVPTDPFDGKPLRYRVVPGGAVVYSVGPDGTDDGGDVDPGRGSTPKDIGVRVWDAKERRRPAKVAK